LWGKHGKPTTDAKCAEAEYERLTGQSAGLRCSCKVCRTKYEKTLTNGGESEVIDVQNASEVPWFVIPLVTAILATIGAWIGGKMGVSRDTEKLTKQRAFDHRLDWYVRTVRTLSDFQFLFNSLNRPDVERERIDSLRSTLRDVAQKLSGNVKESFLFGSPETTNSLEAMYQRLNQLSQRDAEADAGTDKRETEDEINYEFARVYLDLAQDVRKHLELEELAGKYLLQTRSSPAQP
jgi:hypothetical protein